MVELDRKKKKKKRAGDETEIERPTFYKDAKVRVISCHLVSSQVTSPLTPS